MSTEAPVWHSASNSLLFTDIPGNTIYSLDTNSGYLTKTRKPSNVTKGLVLDREGYLLAADQESRTISRMNLSTGEVTPFVSRFIVICVQLRFRSR